MLEYEENNYKIQKFNSLLEAAVYLESLQDLYKYSLTQKSTLGREKSWYGAGSFSEVLDKLRNGDKVQTLEYISNLKELNNFNERDTDFYRDVEGFTYDMYSVVEGEPECCINSGAPEPHKTLEIHIDIGYSGAVKGSTINNRGFAIVNLINTLISKGYILDVYVVHYITTDCGLNCAHLFKINTETLTLSTLAYTTTCSFFRVVSWLLTAIQIKRYDYNGEGCCQPSCSMLKKLKQQNILYIPSGYTDNRLNSCSKSEAQALVNEYYNSFIKENARKVVIETYYS